MTLPSLGPRGEGWAAAQVVLFVSIVVAGIGGPRWSETWAPLRVVAGIAIAIAGLVLFVGGLAALGSSLTPFPRPLEKATLRTNGVYRFARHPIYGGSLLLALGFALLTSPVALLPAVLLGILFELKSRHEESFLVLRFPAYDSYRRRVRWRFIPGVR
jgi:protein-S-isoprenylcysteine O-methyltransferase Ste14